MGHVRRHVADVAASIAPRGLAKHLQWGKRGTVIMNDEDPAARDAPTNSTTGPSSGTYRCGDHLLPVWPDGQEIDMRCGGTVAMTRFEDTDHYHARLTERVLDLESSDAHTRHFFQAAGGIKIYDVPAWGIPEAELLHARSLEMFRRVLGKPTAVADISWANIFRDGDYIFPHSHVRATTSIVYFLSKGDAKQDDPLNGRFTMVDPRVEQCCKEQAGRMTTPWLAPTAPGVMIMFPAEIVHCVSPYRGTRPRLTVAWNVNEVKPPGSPLPD
jgi:hypothetical protein